MEVGDEEESVQKARTIRNEVFNHLKRSNKMTLKGNLTPAQRKVLRELMDGDSIAICPVDKGKVVVVEDRETYLTKTRIKLPKKTMSWLKGKRRQF